MQPPCGMALANWVKAHFATDEEWLFLAMVIELFSRRVVG